jgi:hypothetical protein
METESAQYYERAIELMRLLADSLVPVIERLRKRQELLTMPEPTGGRKIPALH